MRKLESIIYKVTINTNTGLHIGGGDVGIEIGGVDNIVIKDKDGYPYIPGSSLKGKFRSLVEISEGKIGSDGGPHKFGQDIECLNGTCLICRAFGVAGILTKEDLEEKLKDEKWKEKLNTEIDNLEELKNEEKGELKKLLNSNNHEKFFTELKEKVLTKLLNKIGPTRMIVRDLFLSEEDKQQKFDEVINRGENPLEEKTEVAIDRCTGTAAKSGPRTIERVPAGTEFKGEIVFRVFDTGDGDNRDEKIAKKLFEENGGLLKKLLENDYLGGQGSRGSGQVEITFNKRL